MTTNGVDAFEREMLNSRAARVAACENRARRRMGEVIERAREARGYSVRELARAMGTSLSQVQRIRHREKGGTLTLRTIFRAADTLGLDVWVHILPQVNGRCAVVPIERGKFLSLRENLCDGTIGEVSDRTPRQGDSSGWRPVERNQVGASASPKAAAR